MDGQFVIPIGKRMFGLVTRTTSVDVVAAEVVLRDRLGNDWWKVVGRLQDQPPADLIGVDLEAWHEKRRELAKKVLPAIRAAFNVEPYDEKTDTGLTDLEVRAAAGAFRAFCLDLADLATVFREAAAYGLPFPRQPTRAEWAGLYLCRRAVAADATRRLGESMAFALFGKKGGG